MQKAHAAAMENFTTTLLNFNRLIISMFVHLMEELDKAALDLVRGRKVDEHFLEVFRIAGFIEVEKGEIKVKKSLFKFLELPAN